MSNLARCGENLGNAQGQADASIPASSLEALPPTHIARRKATGRSRPRMLSCFARGWLTIMAALRRGEGVALGRFLPEPWPVLPSPARKKKQARIKTQVAQEAAS